jgi:hypothetical protein
MCLCPRRFYDDVDGQSAADRFGGKHEPEIVRDIPMWVAGVVDDPCRGKSLVEPLLDQGPCWDRPLPAPFDAGTDHGNTRLPLKYVEPQLCWVYSPVAVAGVFSG